MSALVVDTSSWISYFAGSGTPEIDIGLKEGRVYLSPVVASELLSGKLLDAEEQKLRTFLSELPLCENDLPHWFRVGKLRAALLRKGFTVSTPDAHVAQCAIDLEGELLSEDRILEKIAGDIGLHLISNR